MNESWTSECIGRIDQSFIEEANHYPAAKPKKNYFKKVLLKYGVVAIGIAALLFIALVYPPRDYKLVKEDGNYYIYLDKKYLSETPHGVPQADISPINAFDKIYRDSLQQMCADLRNGRFTAHEFMKLGRSADKEGKITLFDLDHLYEAIFPEDLTDRYVQFTPSDYECCATDKNGNMTVTLNVVTDERLLVYLAHHSEFENTVTISVASPDANNMRENATFQEKRGTFYCYYILEAEHATFYIEEYYAADSPEGIPYSITVYAQTQSGMFFTVDIKKLTERPDVQWLAYFNIQPYQP